MNRVEHCKLAYSCTNHHSRNNHTKLTQDIAALSFPEAEVKRRNRLKALALTSPSSPMIGPGS